MSYDFPSSPTDGQEYTPPVGGQTYVWKSPRWLVKGIPPEGGGGTSGIEDAPADGKQYGRQSSAWSEVLANPTWATLSGKPATFPPSLPIAWTDVSGKPATYPPTVPIAWTDVSGKPATYPPTLPIAQSDVTGLPAALTAKEPTIAAGTTAQYWRGDKSWQALPTGLPDAPSDSKDYVRNNATWLALDWGLLDGKPTTFTPATHSHPQSEVTNLVTDLANKEPAVTAGNPAHFWAGDKTFKAVPAAGVPEAPTDGKQYGRQSSAWTEIAAVGSSYTKPEADAKFVDVAGDTMTGRLGFVAGDMSINSFDATHASWGQKHFTINDKADGTGKDFLYLDNYSGEGPSLFLDGDEGCYFGMNSTVSGGALIAGSRGWLQRWQMALGDLTAETGADSGSDFSIQRYHDDGTPSDTIAALYIKRDSGEATFGDALKAYGNLTLLAKNAAATSVAVTLCNEVGGSQGDLYWSRPADAVVLQSRDDVFAISTEVLLYGDTKTVAVNALTNFTWNGTPSTPTSVATKAYVDLRAPLADPVFTGNPTAPTPATADNDTSIATTAYVKAQGYLSPTVTSTISVGYTFTPANLGNIASQTINPALGNYQYGSNTAAITLTAPTADCAVDIMVTNSATAGAITFSGFTVGANVGDPATNTSGHKFVISIRRIGGTSTYTRKALQ